MRRFLGILYRARDDSNSATGLGGGFLRSKQGILFLATVLVPSTALVLLSARMIYQERELAEKRSRENREQFARSFGSALAGTLERAARSAFEVPRGQSAGALALSWDGRELLLPWEPVQGESDQAAEEDLYTQRLEAGEHAEFAAAAPERALQSYRAALLETALPGRQAHARLAAARVLSKLKLREQSESELRPVLALPLTVRDTSHIPLAFYAAERMIVERRELAEVGDLIERATASARDLAPASLYMLRDLVEKLASLAQQPSTLDRSLRMLNDALERSERLTAIRDRVQKLQTDWSADVEKSKSGTRWHFAEAERRFWAAAFKHPASSETAVVVLDADEILSQTISGSAFSLLSNAFPRVMNGIHADGLPLGDAFPNLQLILSNDVMRALAVRPRIELYLLLITLVVGFTLYGAYLWDLNTRRDLRLAQLRSDFVASVSHELKTPLTSIQMLTETLRRRELPTPKRAEYLDLILREAQRLGRLLKNVLDFSQVERGTKTYHLKYSNLREIVETAARAIEPAMRDKEIRFCVTNELDLSVKADADALEQACLNLLWNAIKYSPSGSVIELQTKRTDTAALIQISDGGCGIHPRDHERIFEPFYRAPEEHNRRIPGTGLGLALVKHIAESHGGAVNVESVPGQGSTFTFSLPLTKTESA